MPGLYPSEISAAAQSCVIAGLASYTLVEEGSRIDWTFHETP